MELHSIIEFIKSLYPSKDFIPLHEPYFDEQEKNYVLDTLESTYVSSVGKYVDRFEAAVQEYTGAKYAVALVNGTQALYLALVLLGVGPGDEVITQSLAFAAVSNAISYTGAKPVYIDVDEETMGMSPECLNAFLAEHAVKKNSFYINRKSGASIKAVLPVHIVGHPCRIDEIAEICRQYEIALVEDAAESLGSFYKGRHTGTFGLMGVLSFNGNKIITTGGGGMLLSDNEDLARRAKHLSTTAKQPHPFEYIHEQIGYNFRLPNLNAALGLAQMEKLSQLVEAKRTWLKSTLGFFENTPWKFAKEPANTCSNYWLNTVKFRNREERGEFLALAQEEKIMARPLWRPMHLLDMYADCQRDELVCTFRLYECKVNLPSAPFLNDFIEANL